MSQSGKAGLIGRMFGRGRDDAKTLAEAEAEAEAEAPDADPAQRADVDPPPPAAASTPPAPEPEKRSWLQRLTGGLSKTSGQLTAGLTSVFTKKKLDAATLEDLEDVLIQADLGVGTAMRITDAISQGRYDKGISPEDVRNVVVDEVTKVLSPVAEPLAIEPAHAPHVILVVGVNGAGKTTTIGKYAADFVAKGHSVMLAAGDTFRAAAIDQLKVWGERTGCEVVARDVGADASGLAFDAITTAKAANTDVLLIDTAGRLQNKQELMDELDKVIRVLSKVDSTAPHSVLLVLDATTGQNALSQVDVFGQRAGVTGLVMTKLDGTARGGILVAIAETYGLPIHAIGVGEQIEDLA
ncbi:MAG: signal recognition particle-docking protein FtsY, partial [Pseudomonadota bacterium]